MASFYNKHKNIILIFIIGGVILGNIFIGSQTWYKKFRRSPVSEFGSSIGEFIGITERIGAVLPDIPASIETTVLQDAAFVGLETLPVLETIKPFDITIDDDPLASFGQVAIKNTGIGNSLNIIWGEPIAKDLASIKLYRSSTFNDLGIVVASLTADQRSFKDTNVISGQTYYYALRGIDSEGNEARQLYQNPGRAIDIVPPSSPSNIELTIMGESSVKISWENPKVDDFNFSRIYRSTLSGQLGKLIADAITMSEYTDTTIIPGVNYYYTITSVDTSLNESPKETSPSLSKQILENTGILAKGDILLLLTNIVAIDAGTGNTIRISWNNPADDTFDHVRIYRSQSFTTLGALLFDVEGGATLVNDNTVLPNTNYYYTLRTIDTDGRESDNTIQYVAVARDVNGPAVPKNISVIQNIPTLIDITWDRPIDSDLSHYRIYRSTDRDTYGALVADNVISEFWTDIDINDNRTYFYIVTSVDTVGNESTKPLSTSIRGGRVPFIPVSP